ncbi:hypothetical protein DPMN_051140 [Dreissena polymorpha]|uniref:Uncharacterized protein n=1 Tax=Dreissena polymorpha TaxID=45954 RepID=A0A9D4HNM8_DREPO|nr:hypothetical protein DPMN_051140 [Dreissena polymorpha]
MDLTGKMFHIHLRGETSPLWMPDIREIISGIIVSPVGAVDWQQRKAGVVLPAALEERNCSAADDEDGD